MPVSKQPHYRRLIIPWYDSLAVCLCLMAAMLAIFFFAAVGLGVSLSYTGTWVYKLIPAGLMLLSAHILIAVSIRLLRRYF